MDKGAGDYPVMGPGVCSDPLIHPGSAQRKLFSNECHSTSHREAEGMQEREAKMCLWLPSQQGWHLPPGPALHKQPGLRDQPQLLVLTGLSCHCVNTKPLFLGMHYLIEI